MTEKKLYQFSHIHQPTLFTDQELAAGLGRNLDKFETILLSAKKEARSISESKDLNRNGKGNHLKKLAAKVDQETRQCRAGIRYDEMIRQVKNEMQPIKNRTDDVVAELRRREIRDHLLKLDPIMQEGAYREAAESGNDLFLEAVESAPVPLKFATQELIEKIQFSRLETRYPQQAARLRDLQTAQQQLDSAVSSAQAEMHKFGLEIRRDTTVEEAAA